MNINELIAKAAETEDQSIAKTGGDFDYTPPAAGKTLGRFFEYIEMGSHVEQYEGKDKPTAPQVRVSWELLLPKNLKEIEVEGGGKKTLADRISVNMPKSTSDKAKFYNLFKTMALGRADIKHMAQMLGEGFLIDVVHNADKNDAKKVYASIYGDKKWNLAAPRIEDPIENTVKELAVPELISPVRIFLWDHPTKETWDSLFIDGERDIKNAKGEVTGTESKNWIQERILSATNFPGSPLDIMLNGVGELPTSEPAPKVEEKVAEKTTTVQTGTLPADTKVETTTEVKPASPADDAAAAMAALGLS